MPRAVLIASISLFLAPALALQVRASDIPRGSVELHFGGGFDRMSIQDGSDDIGSQSEAQIGFGFARALTDRFMLGSSLSMIYVSIDPEGSGSSSASALRGNLDAYLNFDGGETLIPFLLLSFGVIRWSDDSASDYKPTLIVPRIGVGLRVLIGDSAAFVGVLGFENHIHAVGNEDLSARDIGLSFGISAFPGGLQ